MRKPEVLVPLEDLYAVPNRTAAGVSYGPGDGESPEHVARAYGVTVVLDHRDRHAVSLADAYKIRDRRKALADEIQAAHLAENERAGRVAAWQASRDSYWRLNRLRVGRQIGPGLEGAKHLAEISHRLSVEVLALEAAAGIPPDVQRQLTWPSLTSVWTDPESRADIDVGYHPPTEGGA